jgi:hypothetical protein
VFVWISVRIEVEITTQKISKIVQLIGDWQKFVKTSFFHCRTEGIDHIRDLRYREGIFKWSSGLWEHVAGLGGEILGENCEQFCQICEKLESKKKKAEGSRVEGI